jgi:hypothetical protein
VPQHPPQFSAEKAMLLSNSLLLVRGEQSCLREAPDLAGKRSRERWRDRRVMQSGEFKLNSKEVAAAVG